MKKMVVVLFVVMVMGSSKSHARLITESTTQEQPTAKWCQVGYALSFVKFFRDDNFIEHGLNLQFFRYRNNVVFGDTLVCSKGTVNFTMPGQQQSIKSESTIKSGGGFDIHNTTFLGILFNLSKTIKVGPMVGFSFFLEPYTIELPTYMSEYDKVEDDSIDIVIAGAYFPIGFFGKIDLGKGWLWEPSINFNLPIAGLFRLDRKKGDISMKQDLKGDLNIKLSIVKKISKIINIRVTPEFVYQYLGDITVEEKGYKKPNYKPNDDTDHICYYKLIVGMEF